MPMVTVGSLYLLASAIRMSSTFGVSLFTLYIAALSPASPMSTQPGADVYRLSTEWGGNIKYLWHDCSHAEQPLTRPQGREAPRCG